MQIGKKLILVIFGCCVPLIVVACLAGLSWLNSEADYLRNYVIAKELDTIELQIDKDLDSLQSYLEASPLNVATESSAPLTLLPSLFDTQQVQQGLSGQVLPLSSLTKRGISLPRELQSQAIHAGVYFDVKQNLGYFINIQVLPQSEPRVLLSPLTDDYLASLGSVDFATQVKVGAGRAQPRLFLSDDSVVAELDTPSLSGMAPAHLAVVFATQPTSRLVWQYSLFALGALGSTFTLLLVVFWGIRLTVIKPFRRFSEQLTQLDPMAIDQTYINHEFSYGINHLTNNMNGLLSKFYMQEQRSKITLAAISDAVVLVDNQGRVSYINPYAEGLLGMSKEQAEGKELHTLLQSHRGVSDNVIKFIQSGSLETETAQLRLNIDTPKLMAVSIRNIVHLSTQITDAVLVLKDVTQESEFKQQLLRQTYIDPVTGMLNRTAFEQRFATYSEGCRALAVMHLDLEKFKLINDICGHTVGDQMLAKVAKVIKASLPSDCLFARLNGDEFAIAIRDVSALYGAKLLKAIIANVSQQKVLHQGILYQVGMSAGITLAFSHQEQTIERLKDAEIACDAAKRKGSNQIHFYDDRDRELNYQRNAAKWALRIAEAIERNELILYYQKIKKLSSHGRRQRMEILLRIQDPSGRVLPPAQFIAAAERFKLIVEVDKEVIRKAFKWLSLNKQVWGDHCLSINLSGSSLGAEGMVNYILRQQARYAIPSSCVCFEITETSAIQHQKRAMKMLMDLRKRGFTFALDDFGSGFASYGYLKEMPVDYVKIDGCFVKNLASNAKDYAIVKSVNDVCRVMGIETVAEFVENQEIIDKLDVIGVNYGQGYGIGRPQPLDGYQGDLVSEQLLA